MADARETAPILFVTLSLERGGTERHLAEIMPRLAARGWPIALYCLAARGAMADEVEASGVEVIAPPIGGSAWFRGVLAPLRLATTAATLGWVLAARRPRIVHAFLPLPYLVAGPLSVLTARPIRIMSRRNLADYQAKHPLARRIEIALHGWMTAVLGNSHRIGDELLAEGVSSDRLGIIHNGVDTARFGAPSDKARLRAALGVEADAFVGIIVANLNPYKGHADLIRALAGVRELLPARWILLAAGREDGHGAALSALAQSLGIVDHVRFLGSRTDVPDLVRAADYALNVSHEEGFSNAVIEGMAAGLPMIVTRVGGNPEAVVDGETGLVVPPRDPASLGEAIAWLAANPEAAARMGAAGAERVRREFTIEACVEHYDTLYRGLLAGERAGALAPHRPARSGALP